MNTNCILTKSKLLIALTLSFCCTIHFIFSEENSNSKTSPLVCTQASDFAWYQKSGFVSGGLHYAPFTGLYDGLQLRTTFNAAYKIPVLTGKNPLVQGNNITFTGSFELSPISVMPKFSVSFTPMAFISLSAGCMAGTGWELFGSQGMSEYNS